MKPHHQVLRGLPYFLLITLTCACVSVSLPSSKGKKSKEVSFKTPGEPFQSLPSNEADQAWINSKNGHTISYLSDCDGKIDPSLEQLQSESLNVLQKMKITEEKRFSYNGREAISAVAQGEVDGVLVKMKLVTLKKNDCNYSLAYTGVANTFEGDLKAFDRFVQEFKAN